MSNSTPYEEKNSSLFKWLNTSTSHEEKIATLFKWIETSFQLSKKGLKATTVSADNFGENGERYTGISFYTNKNQYTVSLHRDGEDGTTALWGNATSRMSRPGEDGWKGRSLAYGEFCIETWYAIMGDIIACEMVDLAKGVPNIQASKDRDFSKSLFIERKGPF